MIWLILSVLAFFVTKSLILGVYQKPGTVVSRVAIAPQYLVPKSDWKVIHTVALAVASLVLSGLLLFCAVVAAVTLAFNASDEYGYELPEWLNKPAA